MRNKFHPENRNLSLWFTPNAACSRSLEGYLISVGVQ